MDKGLRYYDAKYPPQKAQIQKDMDATNDRVTQYLECSRNSKDSFKECLPMLHEVAKSIDGNKIN